MREPKIAAISVVATIAVMSLLMLVYVEYVYVPQSSSPSLGAGGGASSSSSASPARGLQLMLTINTSSLAFTNAISVRAEERNTLPTTNNVTAAYGWAVKSLFLSTSNGGCDYRDAVGVAILQGYYTMSNVSAGTAMQLTMPGASCQLDLPRYSYAFLPGSSNATEAYGCIPGNAGSFAPGFGCGCGQTQCPPLSVSPSQKQEGSEAVKGYFEPFDFHYLSPGVYTVVGGDEWGALTVLHFIVRNPGCATLQKYMPFPGLQSRMHGLPNTQGAWAFSSTMNSTLALRGQDIRVNGSLANMADYSQTVLIANPLLSGLRVLRLNGSVAWEYEPPGMTSQRIIASGENIRNAVDIPTSQLQAGETYLIVASPTFYESTTNRPLWTDLTTSAVLTVC